ncbi:uncharacterized protein LOC143292837 [Babylonia areolata]|uniref:uncharacterized protein LOC143292837 n=1 Tax=Babylonia areolata TaxID=304850 RepID=UPI003FD1D844
MSTFLFVILLLTSLSLQVTSGTDEAADFQPYDCYKDLCVRRGQFCSDSEERCKDCVAAHCDLQTPPDQCRPWCQELLSATTTTAGGSTTAGIIVTIKGNTTDIESARQDAPRDGILVSPWMIYVGVLVLLVIVVAVLTLLAINVVYILRLHRRFPPAGVRRATGAAPGVVGNGEPGAWGPGSRSNSTGTFAGGVSISTGKSSSPPPKPALTPPRGQDSKSVQTDPSFPPDFTARTASQQHLSQPHGTTVVQPTTDNGSGQRHHKGFDYHILPPEEGCTENRATTSTSAHSLCLPPPPHPPPPVFPAAHYHTGSLSEVVVEDPRQRLLMTQGGDETYPKSL